MPNAMFAVLTNEFTVVVHNQEPVAKAPSTFNRVFQ